jgi:glycosyltransferase involved in cell wall biosynthesis
MDDELSPNFDDEAFADLPMTAGRGQPLEAVAEQNLVGGDARKILLVVTTSDVGGTESFLERLTSRLDREVFSPVVCSLCPPGGVGKRIEATGTPVFSLDMAPRARPLEMIRCSIRLADMIDRLGIDLVQGLLYRANVMGAIAARCARLRPVMVAGQRSLTPMTGAAATLAQRLTRPLIAHTVAVSDAVRERLIHDEGVAPQTIQVIDNGVDTEVFRPGDSTVARRHLGLAEDGLLIGAVSRLAEVKGIPHLLEALAELVRREIPLRLAVVGDGPERKKLEQRTRELGLADSVSFLGVRHDLPQVFPAFDIFCLPSIREGSPQVLLAAMARGCSVVATTAGGIPEVVEEGVSALLVAPGSSAALGKALAKVAVDENLRGRLGAAARQRIQGRFDLARGVRAYEGLYRSLLKI